METNTKMKTTAEHLYEAVAFLEALETKTGVESELVCKFLKTKQDSLSRWRRFVKMISVTEKLKHLTVTNQPSCDQFGNAMADNDSLQTLKIRDFSPEKDRLFIKFLACLERNSSLVDISFENCDFETEAVEFILGSSVLRVRLVSIGIVGLNTNKQIYTPLYKCSRLTELRIDVGLRVKRYAVLRNLCFCEQLKKLDIGYLKLKDLFLAFPKWKNELENVFPLANSFAPECPFTSLLKDMLTSNVLNNIAIPYHYTPIRYEPWTPWISDPADIRSFLAAAERKERGTKMHVPHQPDRFIREAVLFVARLRSKDASYDHDVIWV